MFFTFILLPLLSFLVLFFFGTWFGNRKASFLSSFTMCLVLCIAIWLLLDVFYRSGNVNFFVLGKEDSFNYFGKWLSFLNLVIFWDISLEPASIFMFFLVSVVSFCVHCFSCYYMENDPHLLKFMSYLSLFTFFMYVLIFSSNLVALFIGWEGIGLCSFLLINFWSSRLQAVKSACKAMLVNKIGDAFLLISLVIIFNVFNSISFIGLGSTCMAYLKCYNIFLFNISFKILDLICFCLIFSIIAKSAQIGLHTWLPDAMEGPTPVSALIHAATMVTAGIFLIIKMFYFFEMSIFSLNLCLWIGLLTIIFSSLIGLTQYDIKKIIAYSTCSQLGYMFLACSLSGYSVSLFHLFNHGFFKALLFLSSGVIIHGFLNEQDIRKMGSFYLFMPVAFICFTVASLVLAGFPFFSGFYSKDAILDMFFMGCCLSNNFFLYIFIILSLLLTCLYSFKIIFFSFLNKTNTTFYSVKFIHEYENYFMYLALFLLFVFSIIIGFIFQKIFSGMDSFFF